MKTYYTNKPATLELMYDGYHLFRFNIEEVVNGETTQFQCDEVKIFGAVTSNKITEVAIADLWGNGVEQKLINDYNEYKLGVGVAESETKYLEFLTKRRELKLFIESIC